MGVSRSDRARQFLPFDALKGLQEALREKEIELDEKTYVEHPVNKSDTINIDDKNIDFNLLNFIKSPLN